MKIRVLHGYYGCDTGCCGHYFEIDGKRDSGSFDWDHPEDIDFRAFAEQRIIDDLGAEHVKDLDWENSVVIDD